MERSVHTRPVTLAVPKLSSRCTTIGTLHVNEPGALRPRLSIRFYRTYASNEPVREWLLACSKDDRRKIGEDLKTVQYAWPVGMPLVRKLEPGLWELRTSVRTGAVRVFSRRMQTRCCSFTRSTRRRPRRHGMI